MAEPTIKPDDQNFDADLSVIDRIIADAAAAIDSGDYHSALIGFKQALQLAKHFFGENIELTELEGTIAEINEQLEN